MSRIIILFVISPRRSTIFIHFPHLKHVKGFHLQRIVNILVNAIIMKTDLTFIIRQKFSVRTHSEVLLFSEKTLSRNSLSLWGSKVDGMMTYSPGFRQKRSVTSRMLT